LFNIPSHNAAAWPAGRPSLCSVVQPDASHPYDGADNDHGNSTAVHEGIRLASRFLVAQTGSSRQKSVTGSDVRIWRRMPHTSDDLNVS
jgi:hypothetical protein